MDCRVLIYGDSLFMAVIEAALQNQPGIMVMRVEQGRPNAPESIFALEPEVIFLDDSTSVSLAEVNETLVEQTQETRIVELALRTFVRAQCTQQRHPIQNVEELVALVRCASSSAKCK